MKAFETMRLGLTIAMGVLLAGAAMAQGPGGGMGMGASGGMGPGFGEHRPPMERAFGPGGDHGRWWNNPKMVERLKLTDEQRKTFDGILLGHREKLIDLRANVEKAELELEPLIKDDQPNEGRILSQIDKVAQARAELEKANARFLLAIRSKLTPEQWKQMEAFRANRGANRGDEHRGWERGGEGREGRDRDRQGPGGQHHHRAPAPQPAPDGAGPEPPTTPQAPGASGAGAEQ